MPLQSHLLPLPKGLTKTKGDFKGRVCPVRAVDASSSFFDPFLCPRTDPSWRLPYLSASSHPLFYIDFRVKNEKDSGSISYFDFSFGSPNVVVKRNVFTDEKPLFIEAVEF